MCIGIFVEPCPDKTKFLKLIDDVYDVGDLEDCAHIFACVYRILTTFHIEKASSTGSQRFTKAVDIDEEIDLKVLLPPMTIK
jgi:hypothetical protein